MNDKLAFKKYLKWLLLGIVFLLFIINYFALKEIVIILFDGLNSILSSFGYNFDTREPISFIFNALIPSLGLVGFIFKTENTISLLTKIYAKISFIQLILLIIILPTLLYFQNLVYGRLLIHGKE